MHRTILVPLDGSAHSEAILDYLPLISEKASTIHLIAVVETSRYYAALGPESLLTFDLDHWRTEAQNYLGGVEERLVEAGYRVQGLVEVGVAADLICDHAEAIDADLIAMTTHGRSGLDRLVLGSVTTRVMRRAGRSIFLVRPHEDPAANNRPELQRIMVPLDGSLLSESAIDPALALAVANEASIVLVRAVEPVEHWVEANAALYAAPLSLSIREREQKAAHYLDMLAGSMEEKGLSVECCVEVASPIHAISQRVESDSIDLVVMSTHGRSGIGRWLFGSVAERAVQVLTTPILLIRSPHAGPAADRTSVNEQLSLAG